MKAPHPHYLAARAAGAIFNAVSLFLLSALALIMLFWRWRPLAEIVWRMKNPLGDALLHGGFALGSLLVMATTFLVSHFELSGQRHDAFEG